MDKLAIVTGGGTGIGRHIVVALLNEGYQVIYTYPEMASSLDEDLASWQELDVAPRAMACDAGDETAVRDFYEVVQRDYGRGPDLIVNNAGIQTWSPLLELSVDDWDRVIRTNLRGCFLNTQLGAKAMIAGGVKAGAIVNLGSGCNKVAFPRLVDYTASKGGIEQLTKVSALELGPYGIRVNCVAPGAIETERTREESADYASKWAHMTPLRRIGQPEDIANAIMFLASEKASFITGQTLWVDGGVFSQAPWPEYE